MSVAQTKRETLLYPTCGRLFLDTTAGDIDIELWSKVHDATTTTNGSRFTLVQIVTNHTPLQEAPKACRNSIVLALEDSHGGFTGCLDSPLLLVTDGSRSSDQNSSAF